MATWGTNGLTNKGRALQNKAQAGVQLKYTKIVIGDGQLGNQSIGPLNGVISPKMTVPITRLYVSGDNAKIGIVFNNEAVVTGFTWREVGIYAQDPDAGEIMYWYANAGTTGSYIPPGGGADIVEQNYDLNVFVGTATNITAVINESLVYATKQDVDAALQTSKDYTDTAISNVKVPDASTTVKGIVKLNEDYKSTSQFTVPNNRALSNFYGISLVDRGKPFSVDWNFIILPGMHRIDVASLNPTTDHSPPGAGYKGVLFVTTVVADATSVYTQRYVDETGGIFNRIRTIAGTWTVWIEIGKSWRTERAIELGSSFTTAGATFIDFHSSGTGNDYDSRIIAEGGTSATGNGKITVQAATTVLSGGKVETFGQLWVTKNTQFGSTSALSLPIGDADTGFNWVQDGNIDFYSNGQIPVALNGGQFVFKNTAGGYEVLSTAINDLKQSGANAKQIMVDSVNAKRGSASTSMAWAEVGAAIRAAAPVKGALNNTYQITEYPTPPNTRVYSPVWYTFPENTSVITFTASDATNSYMFIQNAGGSLNEGSPVLLFRDANGAMVDFLRITKNGSGGGGDADRFTIDVRWITLDARAREIRLYWYEPRLTTVSIPAGFDFTRPIELLAGAILNNRSGPTVYGTGLRGDLLYQ